MKYLIYLVFFVGSASNAALPNRCGMLLRAAIGVSEASGGSATGELIGQMGMLKPYHNRQDGVKIRITPKDGKLDALLDAFFFPSVVDYENHILEVTVRPDTLPRFLEALKKSSELIESTEGVKILKLKQMAKDGTALQLLPLLRSNILRTTDLLQLSRLQNGTVPSLHIKILLKGSATVESLAYELTALGLPYSALKIGFVNLVTTKKNKFEFDITKEDIPFLVEGLRAYSIETVVVSEPVTPIPFLPPSNILNQ